MLKDAFLVPSFHRLVCYGTYVLVPFVLHYHLLTRDDCFLLAVPCFTPAFPGVLLYSQALLGITVEWNSCCIYRRNNVVISD